MSVINTKTTGNPPQTAGDLGPTTGSGSIVLATGPTISAPTISGVTSLTGAVTDSTNGAASTPPLFLTGTILTGGTGTTNFPHLFIQPAAATGATTWSTNGTAIGVNSASGFAGNFIDFRINGGASLLSVTSAGAINSSGAISGSTITGNTTVQFATTFKNSASGHVLMSSTAPAIGSGFGTSPSIVANNGTAAFTINVGTGGVATSGVVTMPAATTGWACTVTPAGAPQAGAEMFAAPTSTTSITITNYTASTGVALAWPASTVLQVTCIGY